MKPKKPDEQQVTHQGASENDTLRHKGGGREDEADKHAGPKPEGNGGTGQPAAFPEHN
ncbi:hypothetical protein [Corallococcus llansteffanensis]|uniref:hypothetical protein n=1 Tax=Corallococcus llansteffanensis TaxID=2316731 RepID=UPI00142EF5CE|nr:hypothetical protein [Corallococcus llansteffanensis]